jgi:hypothetical protein
MPAFYIVLEEKTPGVDPVGLEGRALSKHSTELDALAKRAGVKPLLSFFSVEKDEAAEFLDAAAMAQLGIEIPDKQWFSAEDGLATISALLAAVAADSAITRELREFQQVLEAARDRRIRWHLAIDY